MITEDIVPLKISNLIKRQFPDWFIEQGPTFVAFVQAYYEWMESTGNPLYYSRNYYNIKDIDRTFDEFIIYFKEKYLKGIQLTTESDTKLLVKHCLDIYRSKGTERCIRLLFQLVFNRGVKFYYPSLDLFKLSDGQWYRPKYLELRLSERNTDIIYKQIKGLTSGAIGYVDSVVRRSIKGRLIDVAYISAINGLFLSHEKVQPLDLSIDVEECPVITGSLTSITIPFVPQATGEGYKIGDVVSLSSIYGDGASGVVTGTVDQFGIVDSELLDGGYGYQGNANDVLYISNTMLNISNIVITNTGITKYFSQFDLFTQSQAVFNYNSATGNFAQNDHVYTYYGNAAVMGHGVVLEVTPSSANGGTLLVGIISGNISNTLYTSANVVTANKNASNGYIQADVSGKFVANDDYVTVSISNTIGNFNRGEVVYQPSGHGILERVDYIAGANSLIINTVHGIFKTEYSVTGNTSGAISDVSSIAIGVGLCNTVGVFYSFPNNIIIAPSITGTISKVETGFGYDIQISKNLLYPETIQVNSDLLAGYLSKPLNAATYGFPANTSANLASIIATTGSYTNVTIGKIEVAITLNPGTDYSKPPYIVLDSPLIRDLEYHDFALTITGANLPFTEGEIVTQAQTNARGMVVSYGEKLIVQDMRYYPNNVFVVTSNANTVIVSSGGSTANIVAVDYDDYSEVMGHNFKMSSDFVVGKGAISSLDVIDSGFGFLPGATVNIGNSGSGIAVVSTHGVGGGYYRKKGGFLSDQKKLFDGYYWQNYSYEIISSLTLTKYQQMIKQLSHPAGTIMFGKLQYDTVLDVPLTVTSIMQIHP